MNIKHVLDLTPSPSTAAAWLIGEYGVSYCCIASTETAATWFRNKVRDDLMKMCGEEGTKLYEQCQRRSGMVHDSTQAMPAPVVPKKRPLGGKCVAGGGEALPPGAAQKKKQRKTPKESEDVGTPSSGGGTGGGSLD